MSESLQDAFNRGHTAGEIAEQLRRHDTHFKDINGSIDRTASALEGLRMDVQRLADQAQAAATTVIATAAALKDADEARRNLYDQRRNQSDASWIPYARVFAVLAAIATVLVIVRFFWVR